METPDPLAGLARALRAGDGSSDFDLDGDDAMPAGAPLREAGVLVAFWARQGAPHLILTRRSAALRHHPGQIAFPGGKVEPGDGGPIGAALREAEEEIGLARTNVEVLGEMPAHRTATGFRMTPVLARVRHEFTPRPEHGEVEEVFTVPWAHLADLANYSLQSRPWRGRQRSFYAVPYGRHNIWGATARILHSLAERAV